VTSDPDFKVTTLFEVEYRKNGVTIAQEETILNMWMVLCLVTLTGL